LESIYTILGYGRHSSALWQLALPQFNGYTGWAPKRVGIGSVSVTATAKKQQLTATVPKRAPL